MYQAFIDLDELIVRCRDKQAKQFIKEAVACYKAGAYRSCIVATWNAVVFDFLHKLTELKLLGDGEASKLLEQFEKLSSEKKVKELWQFESDIPKKALKPFELISIVEMSDDDSLNDKIQPYLLDKIQEASIEKLLEVFMEIEHKDKLINEIIQSHLQDLLSTVSLDEIMKLRQQYNIPLFYQNKLENIHKVLDDLVKKLVENVKFDDLVIMRKEYQDELLEELLKPALKEDPSKIVSIFIQSNSYKEAASNARLLLEVADSLSPAQWQSILDAFCNNNQIYDSGQCPDIFISLFQKSLEINDEIVQPYWLSFRTNLNKFNSNNRYHYININKLKKLIDSQYGSDKSF